MKKRILHSDRWPESKGPYSVALTLDHLLFINECHLQQVFQDGPAGSYTVEVARLPFDIMLEVDVIAYIPQE